VRQHRLTAARYYAEPAQWQQLPFWQARAVGATPLAPAALLGDLPGPHALVQCSAQSELREVPCLRGHFVAYQRALTHPVLPRPVAYWADIELAPLLELLPAPTPVAEVIRRWATQIPPASALALFRWLWGQAILVASPLSGVGASLPSAGFISAAHRGGLVDADDVNKSASAW
jgi:hypothetical protein